jgi:sugar phosphate isomerase/epimerase
MNRKAFIKNTGLFSLATVFNPHSFIDNNKLIKNVGLGLFSIPKKLDTNFEEAISMVASMGFKEIELYGPYDFSTEKAKNNWNAITPQLGFKGSGFFGNTAEAVKKISKSHGISIPSLHTDFDTLQNNITPLLDAANLLGAKYVVLPSIPDEYRQTLDDYKKTADLFNRIGENAKKQGVRFAYHNHGYGLQKKDGRMPIDIIFDETDPSLVYFEMDLYWTVAGGVDPVELFTKHKGRYKMMHVKDMKEKKTFAGDGGNATQWIALFPYMCSAGDGVIDLPNILKAAKENGVDHFFVEQDMVANPEVALKKSIDFLQSIQ